MLEEIENIRKLIAGGKTEEAIDRLLSLIKESHTELRNQVLILSSRLGSEIRDRRLGINVDKNEVAQINLGVLEILDEIEHSVKNRIKRLNLEIEGEEIEEHGNTNDSPKNKKNAVIHRGLLEEIKNIIIESLYDSKVEITKIRATIIDDNFQYWEAYVSEESRWLSKNKKVISNTLYCFWIFNLNVLNFSWKHDFIELHVYVKDHEVRFFKMKK